MFCSNCGKEVAENQKFCSNCGKSLTPESPDMTRDVKEPKRKNNPLLILLIIILSLGIVIMGAFFIIERIERNTSPDSRDTGNIIDTPVVEDKDEYYPGTKILSFTSATGIPVTNSSIEEGLNTYTYVMNDNDDYKDYIKALEKDGYEKLPEQLMYDFKLILCKKEKNLVGMGFSIDPETQKEINKEVYVLYVTNAGEAHCLSCAVAGHDICQGHHCEICGGAGSSICNGCGGSGMASVPSSFSNRCVVCYGLGTQICPNCDGAGKTFVGI